MSYLKENGIQSTFHYIPLHSSPAGKAYSRVHGEMTNTDHLADCLVRLPLHCKLSADGVSYTVKTVLAYFQEENVDLS